MSLYSFKIIDAVANEHSFTKAAEALHMTPSAVSHAVSKLEQEFDLQLFVRSRQGARLTQEGEKLLPYIHTILQCHELLYLEVAQIHGNLSGSVRLGTFSSVTAAWLPQLLRRFREEYPGIQLTIHQGNAQELADWLENDGVDLAFVVNGAAPQSTELSPTCQDPLVCVAPASYVPPLGDRVTPEDIAGMDLILPQGGGQPEVSEFLTQNHLQQGLSFYIDTKEAMASLVASGLGFGIASAMDDFSLHPGLRTYPIHPTVFRTISLATAHHTFPAPATLTLQRWILAYTAQTHIQNL